MKFLLSRILRPNWRFTWLNCPSVFRESSPFIGPSFRRPLLKPALLGPLFLGFLFLGPLFLGPPLLRPPFRPPLLACWFLSSEVRLAFYLFNEMDLQVACPSFLIWEHDENIVIDWYLNYFYYIIKRKEYWKGIFIWHATNNFISPLL